MGTEHTYNRRPINFKVPPQLCEEWNVFFDTLVRNLHVPDEVVNRIQEKGKGTSFHGRSGYTILE